MIFEETENGMLIDISHKEMMVEDDKLFILVILKARQLYRCHYANVDDDNSDGE